MPAESEKMSPKRIQDVADAFSHFKITIEHLAAFIKLETDFWSNDTAQILLSYYGRIKGGDKELAEEIINA